MLCMRTAPRFAGRLRISDSQLWSGGVVQRRFLFAPSQLPIDQRRPREASPGPSDADSSVVSTDEDLQRPGSAAAVVEHVEPVSLDRRLLHLLAEAVDVVAGVVAAGVGEAAVQAEAGAQRLEPHAAHLTRTFTRVHEFGELAAVGPAGLTDVARPTGTVTAAHEAARVLEVADAAHATLLVTETAQHAGRRHRLWQHCQQGRQQQQRQQRSEEYPALGHRFVVV